MNIEDPEAIKQIVGYAFDRLHGELGDVEQTIALLMQAVAKLNNSVDLLIQKMDGMTLTFEWGDK